MTQQPRTRMPMPTITTQHFELASSSTSTMTMQTSETPPILNGKLYTALKEKQNADEVSRYNFFLCRFQTATHADM